MKKHRQQRRMATRQAGGSGGTPPGAKGNPGQPAAVIGRATDHAPAPGAASVDTASMRFRRGIATRGFHVALVLFLAGVLTVTAALAIPHDFAFFELGFLFTLSIYDLVLAMLGLSMALGMAENRREILSIVGAFLLVMAPMLLFFDPIFHAILQSPLGHELFLIAPIAVMLSGVVLWLPSRGRRIGAPIAAAVVGFSLSLFIGLDDFGIGIGEFALSSVIGALWILIVPGLMLRPFKGGWLTIPARIIGSWLMAIAVIVTVSLYVPLTPDAPPLPDPTLPDGGALDAPDIGLPDMSEMPDGSDIQDGTDMPAVPDMPPENPLLGGGPEP